MLSKRRLLLLSTISLALTACGGTNKTSSETGSDHPIFSWAKVAVTNGFGPSGDITETQPDFTWPAVTGATEYNFGHETIGSTNSWKEYTVSAAEASCTTGASCTYKPGDYTLSIGDQKAWWVRGGANGQWQAWSSAHVFKAVNIIPPAGDYLPSGETNTLSPTFSWPKIGSTTRYELGFVTQAGTDWESYTFDANCLANSCSYKPNYSFNDGDDKSWWVRPVAGDWSNRVDFTVTGSGVIDTEAPTAPASVRSTVITANSASITWDASSDNLAVVGYRVYRNGLQVGTSSTTNYTDANLAPSTQYSYTVRAIDAAQNISIVSNTLQLTTWSAGTGYNTAFTWSPINGVNNYTFGIEYQDGTGWESFDRSATELNCQSGVCSFTPPTFPLNVGDKLVWWVKPVNGDWSSATFVTITGGSVDTQAPTAPSNLVSTNTTSYSVVINWTASTDNIGVTGYRIYRNGQQIGTTAATAFTDTSVLASTTYAYTVVAFDAANNVSVASVTLSITTPSVSDTEAPTAPPALEENKTKAESISMTWEAATDNVAVAGYKVYRDGQLLESTTELKYKDKTVQPATEYTFTVKAFDAANNESAASNTITVTSDTLASTGIDEPAGTYNIGLDIVEMKVKVLPKVGNICIEDEYDGCTFGNVLQDIDWKDEFKPEVKVEFSTDDGFEATATMRQRGGYTRLNPMKSFRVKFDKGSPDWNGEDRVQLIKTFDDPTRTKHKLSYDLFTEINKLPSMRARYVRLTVEDTGKFNFAKDPTYTVQPNYQETDMGIYLQVEYFGEEYLKRRNWVENSRIYKTNSFDFKWYPDIFALDADGKPVDKDAFEQQLEIKEGKDHTAFVEMLQAVDNTSNDFDSVFETYFDRENYLNWLAVNILSNNNDTVKHNFYLYNPEGTKKFYFVPWDYDYAYNLDSTGEHGNPIETPEKPPFWYTHAFRWGHPMHGRFISSAANVDELKQKVTELRQTVFTNSNISSKLTSYGDLIADDVTNQPDDVWSYYWQPTQAERTVAYNARLDMIVENVESNYNNFIKYYDNPMPFWINFAHLGSNLFQASWEPSVSVSGGSITYEVIISTTTDFKATDIVKTITGITSTSHNESLNLASGKYYVRMIARDSSNPLVKWQSASNGYGIESAGGELLYHIFGVVEMDVQ